MVRKLTAIALAAALLFPCTLCLAEKEHRPISSDDVYTALVAAPGADKLPDGFYKGLAEEWDRTFNGAPFPLPCFGTDDPSALPVSGSHAFVVLGYQLQNGEMADELKGRCETAAEAARAFPGSILICTGGATGNNNPERHTEAGLMKQYLSEECGIDPDRILTEENAMTTAENALNTFTLLKERNISSITIVTSSYHQPNAHMLYYTMAAWYRYMEAYSVELACTFSFDASKDAMPGYSAVAEMQMLEILSILRAKAE